VSESYYSYDKELEYYKLDCCDWRAVIEIKQEPLLVILGHKVYKLLDKKTTFENFYKITQDGKYRPTPVPAEEIGVTLPCARCGGDGKTDWVQKVMKKDKNIVPMPHKRDPYGRILKFRVPIGKNPHVKQEPAHEHPFFALGYLTDYLEKGITHQFIYTSLPHLHREEELCPSCYGSGLRVIADDKTELVVFEE
jgi:hypothetical protein